MKRFKFLAVAATLMLVAASTHGVASAALIVFSNRATFDATFPGATIENWDSYANGTTFPDGSSSAGITYNSSAGDALVTSSFLTTTVPNGLGDTAIGFFQAGDSITFSFAALQSAFGIDVNTFDGVNGGYRAVTNTGEVISSSFDPFPSFSTGQFLGFSTMNPFSSLTISAPGGFSYTLDTLRHVTAPVPEPASLTLFAMGLVGVGVSRLRRRTS